VEQALFEKALALIKKPLFELVYEAHTLHRQHHDPVDIQKCTLLSIKTGGCPENCHYCPQSVHYKTPANRESLMAVEEVKEAAQRAKALGAQRFCMGAAWRNVRDGAGFDRVLEMIKIVHAEGLEVCVTLGMLNEDQARRLKEAGVYAYNHNLDTSRDYYPNIITTHTYDDRLNTLRHVRNAGMTVCCGGIIGMGESLEDRCALLAELASLQPQPESVPINLLVPVEGTPLEEAPPIDILDFIRMIATARLLIPKARIRLSAGRLFLSKEAQILAFFAGANSIHFGEKLLTTPNNDFSADQNLFAALSQGREETTTVI
jgi:biotin synthase